MEYTADDEVHEKHVSRGAATRSLVIIIEVDNSNIV